ncbi:MAG: nucleotide exchange factor GrpE [Patescibacteria group bacterium]|jgi:molecular chaperone GrpE
MPNQENDDNQIAELQAKCAEYLSGWQRARADYENLQKELASKVRETADFTKAGILIEILPLYDYFKMALTHIPEEMKKLDWVQGVMHINKGFGDVLRNLEVEEIATTGETFNPEYHESVGSQESEEPDHRIIKEVKTGYKLKDKVIYPAQVIVAENKSTIINQGGQINNGQPEMEE